MARIKKRGARKYLEQGEIPSASVKQEISPISGAGLRFEMTIGNHTVSLTHIERDVIIASWIELEKNWQS